MDVEYGFIIDVYFLQYYFSYYNNKQIVLILRCLFTGQSELYKVLKAYTVYNPKEGYCQAQAPIAAALLMNMPAEEAFWCLICICENYVPGYYASGMYSWYS